MLHIIPKKNIKENVIAGVVCHSSNEIGGLVQLGCGPFRFYITDKNDIYRLKELCEFALREDVKNG